MLVVKVMSAHDKGSHAEVEVKVKKVLYQNPGMKIRRGSITLYPESWTDHGCTCPILNPGQLQPPSLSHIHYSSRRLISRCVCWRCANFVLKKGFEGGRLMSITLTVNILQPKDSSPVMRSFLRQKSQPSHDRTLTHIFFLRIWVCSGRSWRLENRPAGSEHQEPG